VAPATIQSFVLVFMLGGEVGEGCEIGPNLLSQFVEHRSIAKHASNWNLPLVASFQGGGGERMERISALLAVKMWKSSKSSAQAKPRPTRGGVEEAHGSPCDLAVTLGGIPHPRRNAAHWSTQKGM
jgi:hypothetical protein